jgi:YD repeat-containing protein
MNRIIPPLILTILVLACKPESEITKPEPVVTKPDKEVVCKILSHKEFNNRNVLEYSLIYSYDNTGKLIELQKPPGTTKYEYDTKGNLVKTIIYNNSDSKSSETEYTYNASSQLIKEVINKANQAGVLQKDTENYYEYHANGKMKKKSNFFLEFTTPGSITLYNEKGKEISIDYKGGIYERMDYNAADMLVKRIKIYPTASYINTEFLYEYNAQNKVTKYTVNVNNKLNSYITYEYNDKGNLIAQIDYNGDGTVSEKTIFEYTGESYKVSRYGGPTTLMGYTMIEVQNGLKMKETLYYTDNQPIYSINYTYDSYKNMIKREQINGISQLMSLWEWSYQCN